MSNRKRDMIREMGAAREELVEAIQRLADEDWDRATSNPAWTARDILTHLAIAESGNLARMRRIIAGNSELPADWDLNRYNNRQVEKRRGASIGELVESLARSRQEVLKFLDELPDEELDTRGWHGSGREMTIVEISATMANHERSHAKDILTALRKE